LVVFAPKFLLRARQSRSDLDEFVSGYFSAVLDDPATSRRADVPETAEVVDPQAVTRVLLCSGKVAFELAMRRDDLRAGKEGLPSPGVDPSAVAVVRVEQLYPWPEDQLAATLEHYPRAGEVVWVQEEPENMGAWSFAHGRLHRLLRERYQLTHVSRTESASPASGSAAMHQLQQEDLLARAFG